MTWPVVTPSLLTLPLAAALWSDAAAQGVLGACAVLLVGGVLVWLVNDWLVALRLRAQLDGLACAAVACQLGLDSAARGTPTTWMDRADFLQAGRAGGERTGRVLGLPPADYGGALQHAGLLYTGNPDTARDLAQDTLIKA